uniref:Major sperm protein n=1 Tax=Parascaris univalens TaxID=6257 RepID=A0A915APR5_PARUN
MPLRSENGLQLCEDILVNASSRGIGNSAENVAIPSRSETIYVKDNDSIPNENIKVLEENATTNSLKHRKGTRITFYRSRDAASNLARANIQLCNNSDRPLRYKLKGEQNVDIAAQPSGKGYISAHGTTRLLLTWHRADGFDDSRKETKLVLYTQFFDMKDSHRDTFMAVRLIATVMTKTECDPNKPPVQQLVLDAESKESTNSADTSSINGYDTLIVPMPVEEVHKVDQAKTKLVDRVISWVCAQSRETLCMLIICAVIVYTIGVINSSLLNIPLRNYRQ